MGDAPHSLVPPEIIDDMVAHASRAPSGCFVEVGVYKGGTAWHLARVAEAQKRPIFLYDTFTGIPYQGDLDYHRVGEFGDTSIEAVRKAIPYATVIQGVFPGSAVDMPPVAFVHLDCDQYESILSAVYYLLPMLVPGAVVWFDDTIHLKGARSAMLDLVAENALPPPRLSPSGRNYAVIP